MSDVDAEPITIRTYALEFHAQADRAFLEGEGIPALVLSGEPVLHHGLGDFKLIVPRFLEKRALEVINRAPSSKDDDLTACMACGAPMAQDVERCEECGWSFADGGDAEVDEPE